MPGLLYQFEVPAGGGPGRFVYVNERGSAMFGLSVAQMLADANAVFALIEVEDRRLMLAALREATETLGEWRCEFRARRADGQQRWLLSTASPERMAYGRLVWHGYVEDVTERRLLEQARHDAAVAEAASRAKTDFLSRMSHELRTPLNAVLGFAQLMEIDTVEPPGEGQRKRLKLVREAGEHLLHMISDLLDLTRIEAGGLRLEPQAVALRWLAAQALELVRESAERAQVQLVLVPGEEFSVFADPTRLRQVLLNLLGNAIKYNRPGGRVELRIARGADGRADLFVSDTGIGISEAELPRVFEPFERGRRARGAADGAGIGLAVTRALVQLMGGSVDASSREGEGSVFRVRLPLAPEPRLPADQSAT